MSLNNVVNKDVMNDLNEISHTVLANDEENPLYHNYQNYVRNSDDHS